MTLPPAVLDAMLASGCTSEQIVAAVKAATLEAAEREAARKEKERLRKREERARKSADKSMVASSDVHGQTRNPQDGADTLSSQGSSPTPLTPNPSNPSTPFPPKGGLPPTDFDQFWAAFPNRTGKGAARKAWPRAIAKTDLGTMLTALAAYSAKTDDRPWCNPATWLNEERWADQPPKPVVTRFPRGSPPKPEPDKLADVFAEYGNFAEEHINGHPLRSGSSERGLPAVVQNISRFRSG